MLDTTLDFFYFSSFKFFFLFRNSCVSHTSFLSSFDKFLFCEDRFAFLFRNLMNKVFIIVGCISNFDGCRGCAAECHYWVALYQ